MRVLVIGAGVIGTYLTHALCVAGNDVTLVARGTWGEALRERGLVIRHYVQHRTTVDHPLVMDAIPPVHFDVAFSVMRQDQQLTAIPQLATIDAEMLVLVGNNVRAEETAAMLAAEGFAGRLVFGFQSTAGNREGDHAVCVRWGATGLDVGPLHGKPEQVDKDLLGRVFAKGGYQPHWTHDFNDWLLTHAAAVVPMCYVSYICGCDMHKATPELLHRMIDAQGEAYALLVRLGYQIMPESDEGLFDGGAKTHLWYTFVWIVAHTSIGTLCIDKHAMHAPDEMRALSDGIEALRTGAPEFSMPTWDELKGEMGGWDAVLARWGR